MKIRMRYFASLRETTGLSEETLIVPEASMVRDIRALLLARYPRLQPIMDRTICAVNQKYVSQEAILHDGDELVFIPPMGGGSSRRI